MVKLPYHRSVCFNAPSPSFMPISQCTRSPSITPVKIVAQKHTRNQRRYSYETAAWTNMEFCNQCGSRMIRTKEGFACPKCYSSIRVKPEKQRGSMKKRNDFDYIYVSGSLRENQSEVSRQCPNCGNKKALHWYSGISGEHAGITRERTVEHFKCPKCSHSWTEES